MSKITESAKVEQCQIRLVHGHCRRGLNTSAYRVWQSMKKRCINPNSPSYRNYGARGISVCQEWMDSFASFLADMGEMPLGFSLERRDNDQGYSKSNCYWATRAQQSRNTRQNVMLTFKGITQCKRDWEIALGLSDGTIWHRLKMGWSIERALTERSRQKP